MSASHDAGAGKKRIPDDVMVLWHDEGKCIGCRICELECAFFHSGKFNPALARIQIERDDDLQRDSARYCHSCRNAPCVASCGTGAMSIDAATGGIIVDEDLCLGEGDCVASCPFSAVHLHPVTGKALACDKCGGEEPRCVSSCPEEAIILVTRAVARKNARTRRAGSIQTRGNKEG